MTMNAILIGHQSLAQQCGQMWLEAGHRLAAVVTRHPGVRDWAVARGLSLVEPGPGLADRLPGADWLLSVANLDMLPDAVLARAAKGAVNFHDGPLPRRAGLNAPVWAIMEGDAQHGIAWHRIAGGVDEGPVLAARAFELAEGETALTLNARCFQTGMESFPEVIAALAVDAPGVAQDLGLRTYKGRDARAPGAGLIDPRMSWRRWWRWSARWTMGIMRTRSAVRGCGTAGCGRWARQSLRRGTVRRAR